MKVRLRSVLGTFSVFAALGSMPAPSHAYVYSSEGQYATWTNGSGFTINNLVWGNPNPSQWMNITNINTYNFYSNQTGNGVKSYPNEGCDLPNVPLSSLTQMDDYFDITAPAHTGAVQYNYVHIITTQNDADEVMLYENWYNQGPSTTTSGGWANLIYSNVSFGGSTWNVTVTNPAYQTAGHQCFFIFRTSQRSSGYTNMLDAMNWLKSKGLLYNTNVSNMTFGVEIWNTIGWQYFNVNNYTATWKTATAGMHI